MSITKLTVSIDERVLARLDKLIAAHVFQDRSQAIQAAVEEILLRLNKSRLARECGKLDPAEEQSMAKESIAGDISQWPAY